MNQPTIAFPHHPISYGNMPAEAVQAARGALGLITESEPDRLRRLGDRHIARIDAALRAMADMRRVPTEFVELVQRLRNRVLWLVIAPGHPAVVELQAAVLAIVRRS